MAADEVGSGPDRPRLFAALVPSLEAARSLAAELDRHPADERLRWAPASQWHITLAFFGADDAVARASWLRTRLCGAPAPTLNLAGAGTFPGVLWVGVHADHLTELADAAGAGLGEREYRAHLTLARTSAHTRLSGWVRTLAGYRGPSWTGTEAVLMRSDKHDGTTRYTIVDRFPLGADPAG